MKRIFVAGFAALMFFAACQDSGSSTIGTYEKDEAGAADTKKDPVKEESMHSNTSTSGTSADSAGEITGVRKDSVSASAPTQAETSVEKKNVKAQKTKEIDKKP